MFAFAAIDPCWKPASKPPLALPIRKLANAESKLLGARSHPEPASCAGVGCVRYTKCEHALRKGAAVAQRILLFLVVVIADAELEGVLPMNVSEIAEPIVVVVVVAVDAGIRDTRIRATWLPPEKVMDGTMPSVEG